MPKREMRTVFLSCFKDEGRTAAAILGDGDEYVVTLQADAAAKSQGYFVGVGSSFDFFAATRTSQSHGVTVPDWSSETLFGIDGRVYSSDDVISCRLLDLIIFRWLRVSTKKGPVRKRYFVKLKDCLIPADPMYPWGNDLYKFMGHHLSKRR